MFCKGRLCRNVSKPEATQLLELLREHTREKRVCPKQLGAMGRDAWKHADLSDGYACEEGTFNSGTGNCPYAQIPFLVEVWAATCEPSASMDDGDDVYAVDVVGFTINRSPAIIRYNASRIGRSRDLSLTFGETVCYCSVPKGAFAVAINITSPHIHILGDNK